MRKADILPPYCAVVKKPRSLNFLDPSGPAWAVTGVLFLYLYSDFTFIHACLYLVAFINRLDLLQRVRIVGAPVTVPPVCPYEFTPKCGTNFC